MMWHSKAWNTLPDKTCINCFCTCGISEEVVASATADDGNLFAGLEEDTEDAIKTSLQFLQIQKTSFESQDDGELTIDDYIGFDQELSTKQSTISDKDIIHEVINHPVEDNSGKEADDDAGVVELRNLLMEEVKSAAEMLEKFSLHSDFGKYILKSIQHKLATLQNERSRPNKNKRT